MVAPDPGRQSSPWIIRGSAVILLVVVMVMAFQNTNREKRYNSISPTLTIIAPMEGKQFDSLMEGRYPTTKTLRLYDRIFQVIREKMA